MQKGEGDEYIYVYIDIDLVMCFIASRPLACSLSSIYLSNNNIMKNCHPHRHWYHAFLLSSHISCSYPLQFSLRIENRDQRMNKNEKIAKSNRVFITISSVASAPPILLNLHSSLFFAGRHAPTTTMILLPVRQPAACFLSSSAGNVITVVIHS